MKLFVYWFLFYAKNVQLLTLYVNWAHLSPTGQNGSLGSAVVRGPRPGGLGGVNPLMRNLKRLNPKGRRIADAERHRRTPRLSAISGKAIDVWGAVFYGLWPIQCATLAEIGDAAITVLSKIGIEKVRQLYCKTGDRIRQISCQNLQNKNKISPTWRPISIKNQ